MRYVGKKSFNSRRFTLVELLVAMGVFSILLMLSMQLFSGMQKLWVNSERRNEVFSTARTAMEFVAARLQTVAYSEEMPFLIHGKQSKSGVSYYTKIFFPTYMPMNRINSENNKPMDSFGLRFLAFEHDATHGTLVMKILSAKDADDYKKRRQFTKYLPPYDSVAEAAAQRNSVKNAIENLTSTDDVIEVIDNVIDFRLVPYAIKDSKKNSNVVMDTGDSNIYEPPYVIEIEFTVLDSRERFLVWKDGSNSAKEDLETEHSYTFRRAVILSDRRKFEK